MIQTESQPMYVTYAALITEKIIELIDEEIGIEQLEDSENVTQLFHALANVAPNHLYNKLTGDNVNNLEFNHLANKLCFQFMTGGKAKKTTNEDEG